MRLDNISRSQDVNQSGANGQALFDASLRVAQKQEEQEKPAYRMATGNEVWPPVRETEIVSVPEDAKSTHDATGDNVIAFRAGGETVVVKREVNPRLFDYIDGIKAMAGSEMNTLRKRDERILRNDETVPLQDLKDIKPWAVDGKVLFYTAKDKDGKGIAVSKELTPEFFHQVDALHKGNAQGFTLKTDPALIAPEDLVKADIQPADERNGFVNLTINGKKIQISEKLTPKAYDQVTTFQKSQADIKASEKAGYKLAGPTDYPDDKDIVSWGKPDDFANGIIRFELKNGDKFVVSKMTNKPLYDRIVEKAEGTQTADVNAIREKFGLPPASELNVFDQKTNVDADEKDASKGKLTVSELATKNLIEEYRKGVQDGSIGKDDPRAKLVRALEAKSAFENGRGIIGYEENEGFFGGTWRNSDSEQTQLTSADLQDIIDGHSLDTALVELFADPTVSKDYSAKMEEALGKIDSKALQAKLEKLVFGKDSKYMEYIAELKEKGLSHAAKADIAQVVQSLSVLDSEKGKNAAAQLQTDALTMDLNKLVANPDTISEENRLQATKDWFGLFKSLLKSESLDTPRRTIETIEKFIEGFIKGTTDVKTVLKTVTAAAEAAAANGGHLTKEQLEQFKAYIPVKDREGFLATMGKLNGMGILGSLGGGASLIAGIYQLAGKGGALADTPIERLAVAKDFISFIGASSHFVTLADSVSKALGGEGRMVELLGLKKSVPEIWGDKGLNGQAIQDTYPRNSYTPPPAEQEALQRLTASSASEINQASDRISSGQGVNAANFVDSIDPEVADGVQSTLETQAKAAGVSNVDNMKKIGKTALRVLSPVADTFGGIADIILGAFTIKNAIASGSDLGKAAGSLQVIGGASGLAAGGLGLTSAFGAGGALATAAAAPLFLFSVAMIGLSGIIGFFADHEKNQKATDAEGQWYKDLARDGLLQDDWGDKVEYARYSIHRYDGRDAPDGESIYDYQKNEWEYFRKTEPYAGSSRDRLDEDLHISKEMADYRREFFDKNSGVMETIRAKWDDWNGRDTIVSDKDLRKIAADEKRSEAERKAAQFLLDNKGFFEFLDTSARGGGKDGKISTHDLNSWLEKIGAKPSSRY